MKEALSTGDNENFCQKSVELLNQQRSSNQSCHYETQSTTETQFIGLKTSKVEQMCWLLSFEPQTVFFVVCVRI